MPVPRQVIISTGSRLHFGILANPRDGSRQFGGAGLMLDQPGFKLAASNADFDLIAGPEVWKARVEQYLSTYRAHTAAGRVILPCRLEILQAIPPHSGLGSGTQLGLAVAQALAILSGDGHAGITDLAKRVGRGARSALGIHGFQAGGLLVEAGKTHDSDIAPLIARAQFPAEWRILLVRPRTASGLSGPAEVAAFAELAPMPEETTARLCRILLLNLLPAVLDADLNACGDALYEFGHTVGEYFSPAQQGVYAHPEMSQLVTHLRQQGVRGVGQTSWGPTLFVLCGDERQAESLAADLAHSRWADCELQIAAPLNTGAAIQFP